MDPTRPLFRQAAIILDVTGTARGCRYRTHSATGSARPPWLLSSTSDRAGTGLPRHPKVADAIVRTEMGQDPEAIVGAGVSLVSGRSRLLTGRLC